jgi:hypothetical protein
MAEQSRIEDLRRRVERDPASIAFAQLAEEYRRAGRAAEAVETCRAGLALHPGYLSARVTLGRGLIDLGNLEEGLHELELVLKSAPENLAAIRGVAEVHHRQGDIPKALEYFQAALALAKNDPDLQETVGDLTRKLAPKRGPDTGDGLSLEQMHSLFAQHAPPPVPRPAPAPTPVPVRAPEPDVEPSSAHDADESLEAEHSEELPVSEHPSESLSPEHDNEHPADFSPVEPPGAPMEGERPTELSSVEHSDPAAELESVENEASETEHPVTFASEVAQPAGFLSHERYNESSQSQDPVESSQFEDPMEATEFSLEPTDEPSEAEAGAELSAEAFDESDYFEHAEDLSPVEQPELSLEPDQPDEPMEAERAPLELEPLEEVAIAAQATEFLPVDPADGPLEREDPDALLEAVPSGEFATSEHAAEFSLEPTDEPLEPEHATDLLIPELESSPVEHADAPLEVEKPAAPQPPKHLLALEGFLAEIHAARSERRA